MEEEEGGGRGEGGGGGADREKDEKKKKWRERKFIWERREKAFVKNTFFIPRLQRKFSPPAEKTTTCFRHPFTNNFMSRLRSLHPHWSERH